MPTHSPNELQSALTAAAGLVEPVAAGVLNCRFFFGVTTSQASDAQRERGSWVDIKFKTLGDVGQAWLKTRPLGAGDAEDGIGVRWFVMAGGWSVVFVLVLVLVKRGLIAASIPCGA